MCEALLEICPEHVECSIEKALTVLDGKWTFLILKELFDGNRRFGELKKALHTVTPKTLSEKLKKLEEQNVIQRIVYPTVPPAVEYRLTDKGHSLHPIIIQMKLWGAKWG